jgi:vacuolar-type H+-ATPase subunit H
MARKDGKVKEVWGRKFKIVKDGLDEAEVFAFVGRLIEQNSELSSKLEHLDSLKKLAENAVIEATKQAKKIKTETRQAASERAREIIIQAEAETKAEAERIIAEAEKSSLDSITAAERLAQDMLQAAEERAREQAEQIMAEAEQKAREQAEQIMAKAEQNAREQVESETKAETESIIAEAEKSSIERIAASEQLAQDMLQAAEEKARAKTEGLSQEKLSLAEQEAKDIIKAAEEKAEEIKRLGQEEATKIVTEAKWKVEEELALIRREAGQRLPASGIIAESAIEEVARRVLEELLSNSEEGKAPQKSKTKAAVPAPADTGGKEEADEKENPALYSGNVELAIPPPVATNKLLKLHSQLKKARQVKVMDVVGSANKGVIIRLFLRSPTRLIDMLEDLPEVREAAAATKQSRNTGVPQRKPGEPAVRRIVVTI